MKSIFFCFVLSKWRNPRGRTRHVGRSSRPTALSILVQTWADASGNRRLQQTLSPDPERPQSTLPPFKSKQSLSLGRLPDGREELGPLARSRLLARPSRSLPLSCCQLPADAKANVLRRALGAQEEGRGAISSHRPAVTQVSAASSVSLPFSSPSHPPLNLEVPPGEPAPQWGRHWPVTWGLCSTGQGLEQQGLLGSRVGTWRVRGSGKSGP